MGPYHTMYPIYISRMANMEWTVCITKWENLVGSLATEQSHLLFHQPDPLLYQQHGLDEKLIIINNCPMGKKFILINHLGQGVQFIVHRRKLCHHLNGKSPCLIQKLNSRYLLQSFAVFLNLGTSVLLFISVPSNRK